MYYPQCKISFFSSWKYISSKANMFGRVCRQTIFELRKTPSYLANELTTSKKAYEIIEAHKQQERSSFLRQVKTIEII